MCTLICTSHGYKQRAIWTLLRKRRHVKRTRPLQPQQRLVVCIASTISPPYHHHSRAKGTLYLGNITLDNVGTTFRPPERSILALSQDIEGRRREGPGFAAGVDEATAFLRIGSQ